MTGRGRGHFELPRYKDTSVPRNVKTNTLAERIKGHQGELETALVDNIASKHLALQ